MNMRWPWDKSPKQDHNTREETNQQYIDPAREELQKAKKSLNRIDRILLEARQAQAIAQNRKR